MKSFYHYLAESAKEYRYRVKTVNDIDSKFLDTLKRALFKYDIKSVSAPKKMMMQKAPLDFRNFHMAEVSYVDIVLGAAASSYMLATELRGALQVGDDFLVVRGDNEPIELEANAIEEIHKDAEPSLLQTPEESILNTDEVPYGDAYNKKLLNYLAQVKADGEAETVPAIEEVKKTNKFAWLAPKDKTVAQDFNKDFDTVKPVHVNTKKAGAKAEKPSKVNVHGEYTDADIKKKG